MTTSELSHDWWQDDADRRVDWIRQHARTIETMLASETEYGQEMNTRIWRALYVAQGKIVAASLHHNKASNPPLFAQVQTPFATEAMVPPAQQLSGAFMTPTEIAVFFALDDVAPDKLHWVEQAFNTRGIHVVRSTIDGLKR